ncbi:hypothetical protein Droror1_Dr00008333, partial [Drosera rotundifolia]
MTSITERTSWRFPPLHLGSTKEPWVLSKRTLSEFQVSSSRTAKDEAVEEAEDNKVTDEVPEGDQ